jgi:PEP-CTERM motif
LSFDVESSNSSGYDQIIGSVTLTLDGNVVSSVPTVPEPGTMSVLVSGLGAVFFVIRRRRRAP